MLKVLVKKQLIEIFRSYFYNAKKNKAYSKGATAAYVVLFVMLMVGVLGGIFTGMALMICKPMACIPDGADVFRCCNTSGSDCLLGYCGILCKSSGRWYFISGTNFHICNDTFLCPWLDCGKDQPEAET